MGDSTENVGDGHGPSYEAAKREASVHALEYYLRPQGKGSLWNDRWSDLILLPDSRKHFGGACTKGALTKDFDQSRFDLLEPEGLKKERLIKQTTAGASVVPRRYTEGSERSAKNKILRLSFSHSNLDFTWVLPRSQDTEKLA
jgi:hypothetical protein